MYSKHAICNDCMMFAFVRFEGDVSPSCVGLRGLTVPVCVIVASSRTSPTSEEGAGGTGGVVSAILLYKFGCSSNNSSLACLLPANVLRVVISCGAVLDFVLVVVGAVLDFVLVVVVLPLGG